MLPFSQRQIIEQAKFKYPPLGKSFETKNENDWRARKKINRCYWKPKRKTSGFNH